MRPSKDIEQCKKCSSHITNSWLMSENKFMCKCYKKGEEILFLDETPTQCKFKTFMYEKPKIKQQKIKYREYKGLKIIK